MVERAVLKPLSLQGFRGSNPTSPPFIIDLLNNLTTSAVLHVALHVRGNGWKRPSRLAERSRNCEQWACCVSPPPSLLRGGKAERNDA